MGGDGEGVGNGNGGGRTNMADECENKLLVGGRWKTPRRHRHRRSRDVHLVCQMYYINDISLTESNGKMQMTNHVQMTAGREIEFDNIVWKQIAYIMNKCNMDKIIVLIIVKFPNRSL